MVVKAIAASNASSWRLFWIAEMALSQAGSAIARDLRQALDEASGSASRPDPTHAVEIKVHLMVCFKCPRCRGIVAAGLVCVACLPVLNVWHPEIVHTHQDDNTPTPTPSLARAISANSASTVSMMPARIVWRT